MIVTTTEHALEAVHMAVIAVVVANKDILLRRHLSLRQLDRCVKFDEEGRSFQDRMFYICFLLLWCRQSATALPTLRIRQTSRTPAKALAVGRLNVALKRLPQLSYDHARIDQEIFAKLHRSSVVLADITGARPNCFLELGYALGRGLPTMVTARKGASLPFDITTFAGHHWKASGSADERRRAFKEHWQAIRNRPTLVPTEPLIS